MKKNLLCLIFLAPALFVMGQPVSKHTSQVITFRLNAITVIDFSGVPSARLLSSEEFVQTKKNLVVPFTNPVIAAPAKKQSTLSGAKNIPAPLYPTNSPFYFTSSELNVNRGQVLHTASSH